MKISFDSRLYLVTDRDLSLGRPLEWIVAAAVRGGVTAVQLREKTSSRGDFIELARRIKSVLEPSGIPLIINDRTDVALEVRAAGVHLGQDDMPPSEARKLLGPEAVIGFSVESEAQAMAAEDLDIDYLGVSPVFLSPTKSELTTPWGLEGLRRLRPRSRHKLIGIGGISSKNAAEVLAAGADGIAVVSAICSAPDPELAARELRAIIDRTGKQQTLTG